MTKNKDPLDSLNDNEEDSGLNNIYHSDDDCEIDDVAFGSAKEEEEEEENK